MTDEWNNIPDDLDSYMGFVYVITAPDGRKYIGKKQFWTHTKMKPLKGKVKNRRVWKETDWRTYYGSSEEIKEMRKKRKDGWVRDILRLCKSKFEMTYYEAKEIFDRDALIRTSYMNYGIRTLRISPISIPAACIRDDRKRSRVRTRRRCD